MPVSEGQENRVDDASPREQTRPARGEFSVPLLRAARPFPDANEAASASLLPATTLGWIPFWWSRVLFPGKAQDCRVAVWQVWALLILPGLLLYPCMTFYLFEPDEGRYAQIPAEMWMHGEWIVPTLQGEPYLDKPPFFYWCVMLSYALFGPHAWAARLVPALATHGTILLCFFLGRRLVGSRAAFWGALLLALAPGFVGISRLLLLDGLLTFLVTLALFAGYLAQTGLKLQRGWWYLAAAACGLGLLTKGPIALILFVPPLWLTRRLESARCPLPWRHLLGFAAVALAINLPWYVAIMLREPEFAYYFFWQHNIQRFTDPFDHERPLFFFVPLLLVGLLPGIGWLIAGVRFLFSSSEEDAASRTQGLGYLLICGLWCFGFFSLSGSKLPTYILPAFPPLALALGTYFARRHGDANRTPRWLGAILIAWFGLTLAAHWLVVPAVAWMRSPMSRPNEVRDWCGDPSTPVYCFPRPVDSVAFYLGRSDLESHRSKNLDKLLEDLDQHPRAVVLFSHRHSIDLLRMHLPAHLHMTDEAPLGLCKMAKIERR